MLSKFNQLYESIMGNNPYIIDNSSNDDSYKNQTIAIVPGSFKPPHKGHWEMIMEYANNPDIDKVIVLISNISTKSIANRKLSSSNLTKINKINEFIRTNNLLTKELEEGIQEIDKSIEDLSLTKLTDIIKTKYIPSCEQNIGNKQYAKLKAMLESYLNSLSDNVFKSIRKAGEIEITPEMSREIFNIFLKAYNAQDKVEIQISDSASPITDTLNFINNNCKECTILLGVSEKGGDHNRWNGIEKYIENDTVKIIPSAVKVDTMLSATDIRNNITNLLKEYFPDKLSEADFQKIVRILNDKGEN